MPFGTHRAKNVPAPRPQSKYNNGDLLRVAGLFPSQSGKALTGNANMNYEKDGERVGEKLIKLIEHCMEHDLPLRLLVFDQSTWQDSRVPYLLNVTVGQPRQVAPQPAENPADPRAWMNEAPSNSFDDPRTNPESTAGLPAPEPTPRRKRIPPERS